MGAVTAAILDLGVGAGRLLATGHLRNGTFYGGQGFTVVGRRIRIGRAVLRARSRRRISAVGPPPDLFAYWVARLPVALCRDGQIPTPTHGGFDIWQPLDNVARYLLEMGSATPAMWAAVIANEPEPVAGCRACTACPLRIGGEFEASAIDALAAHPDLANNFARFGCHEDGRQCAGAARLSKRR